MCRDRVRGWLLADPTSIGAVQTPSPAGAGTGGIPGGALRPGAIDQGQFQQLLKAQQQLMQQGKPDESNAPPASQPGRGLTLNDYRKLAGIPTANPAPTPAPVQNAVPAAGDGIPTLTLEQFAALTGMSVPESALEGPIPDQTGMPPAAPAQAAEAEVAPAEEESADGVPVLTETGDEAPAEEESGDGRVVYLDRYPDRDEQKRLAAQGKVWRMKETPGARELFMGPDGEFGWDDFVDIINPLQHIPVVAQIYRAVTGDQAYALSNMLGALPFGPASVASAVADIVIRAQTGRDAGTDMAAAVLGIDNRTPEEANLKLVMPGAAQTATSSDSAQSARGHVQVAMATPSWTREGAGIARD
jgi:hypothetical protein